VASYRFCRTDDVPLLVRAHNACYLPHFPGLPPMTVDGFRRAAKEIDLWASSCMVATSGSDPVGVLLACKRDEATLVWRVGIHPEHRRRGHGRHLLTSLGAKLAILGPPRLVAEVPADRTLARAFLEACGWKEHTTFRDFVLRAAPPEPAPSDLVIPVTLDELMANDALDTRSPRCWSRAPKTLINRKDSLHGLAVAPSDRIEAYLLHDDREIVSVGFPGSGFGSTPGSLSEVWLKLLVGQHAARSDRPLRLEKVHAKEIDPEMLRACSFEPAESTIGYATMART